MRADVDALYDETVTVVHRISAKESGLPSDSFVKQEASGCMWAETAQRTVDSNGTVAIGTVRKVQIPESSVPDGLQVSAGDYVFRGEVAEDIDASNIRKVTALYEPDVFQVQHFRDLTRKSGLPDTGFGLMRFAQVWYLEG